jgi:hypothetical protein
LVCSSLRGGKVVSRGLRVPEGRLEVIDLGLQGILQAFDAGDPGAEFRVELGRPNGASQDVEEISDVLHGADLRAGHLVRRTLNTPPVDVGYPVEERIARTDRVCVGVRINVGDNPCGREEVDRVAVDARECMTPVRHEVPLENNVLEYADRVGEGWDCGGVDIAVFCGREDYVQIIEKAVPAKVRNGDGVARDTRQLLTNGLEETPSLRITLDRGLRKRH